MKRTKGFDLPLSVIRERIANSDLLPAPYTRYCRVIADALHFFLQRLPASRLEAILMEQATLAATQDVARRVVALLGHSPVLHKLGQVLARERRLAKSFRLQLQRLESLTPKTPLASVRGQLEREFGDLRRAGVTLERPLAEGSVAVVVPFRNVGTANGTGVFKLLKEGVEDCLEQDLEILSALAGFLGERCEDYGLPALDYKETFETIRELLVHEVRFSEEQSNLIAAGRAYSQSTHVVVPKLLPFCSARVTAMERLWGKKLPQGAEFSHPGGNRWARSLIEGALGQPMVSADEAVIFHGDLHGGNVLLLPHGQVGMLDWSLAGKLRTEHRLALVEILLAACAVDVERAERALQQLARVRLSPAARRVLEESLSVLGRGRLPGVAWLLGLLDELLLRGGVRFDATLVLFRKLVLTLEGVVADLLRAEPQAVGRVFDAVLAEVFLREWVREWPCRFVMPWQAKSSRTHISTCDVLNLSLAGVWAPARWWRGLWEEQSAGLGLAAKTRGQVPRSG